MFKIRKQISLLYWISILGNLSLTGAWVAILAARGFSLVQIGFAETMFHITSLIFEIPSGVLADAYGRKKMLLISSACAVAADLIMAFSGGFFMVCLSVAIRALNYNFASGSSDALAYDSLKLAGLEARYEKYTSNQFVIYRVASGISTLCAGIALYLGYRASYLISAATSLAVLGVTALLAEVTITKKDARAETEPAASQRAGMDTTKNLSQDTALTPSQNEGESKNGPDLRRLAGDLFSYFADSLRFLKRYPKATKLMFANSFVGAVDILLLFFLQSKLSSVGLSNKLLGIALFVMELGGVLGARVILHFKKQRYAVIFLVTTLGVISGVALEHSALPILMVLGGFLASMSDDALQVRTDARLQEMFPSEQRATLISISSFTFSVIMIVLSPIAGYFFTIW